MAEMMNRLGESDYVAVLRSSGEYALVARRSVPTGSLMFTLDGELTDKPTRYSVQLGREVHLDLPESYRIEDIMDRFYWRFMNHSCAPNSVVRGRAVFAGRPIEPGHEINFDYNTTEYELAEPFECRCGAENCLGWVRGFRYLGPGQRARLRPLLSDHLRSLLESADVADR